MSIFGVDYTSPYLNIPRLKANGVKFVGRYLAPKDPIYTWKRLTKAEVSVLKLGKIDLVSVFETGANRALKGFGAGQMDAAAALSHLQEVGAPPNVPVYFAVDFDATPGEQLQINSYFDGVASRIKKQRIGGYGGFYVIKRLFDAGVIEYGWQTSAWSGGQWDPRAHIRQLGGGKIGALAVDHNYAQKLDYGQWNTPHVHPKPVNNKAYLINAFNKDGSEHWLPANRVGAAYEFSRFLAGKYKSLEFTRAAKVAK